MFPAPTLGSDQVIFCYESASWVAMADESHGTRFLYLDAALRHWHRNHCELCAVPGVHIAGGKHLEYVPVEPEEDELAAWNKRYID